MASQVVFLVHGIGDQKKGWSKPATKYLDDLCERYTSVSDPISKQVKFVEVFYGDIFDKQLARWDEDVDTFKAEGVVPQAADAMDWLDGITEGGFVWTHAGDVVLFLSRITRNAVVAEVTAQLAAGIGAALKKDTNTEFSIVAHSLGTAVTMEAVQALATPIPMIGWELQPDFVFREIIMLSNTSRLLQRPDLRASKECRILPRGVQPDGLCLLYRNVFHRRDPVSWVRKFGLLASLEQGYASVPVEHYYARNIHGITHYLEHPAVHGALLRLPAASNLPLATWEKAIRRYDNVARFGGEFGTIAEVETFIQDVDATEKPDFESETQLVKQMKYIVDVLRKFA